MEILSYDDWREWYLCCSLERCRDETKTKLIQFARHRFHYYLRVIKKAYEAPSQTPSTRYCWHLFETQLIVGKTRAGKSYKNWLFARIKNSTDDPLDVVQGGATLLVRWVVRNWAKSELRPKTSVSYRDKTNYYSDLNLTVDDLLPSHGSKSIEQVEIYDLADKLLPLLYRRLNQPEYILLLSRHLGIPLSHPLVLQLTKFNQQGAYRAWNRIFRKIADVVRSAHPDEDVAWLLRISMRLTQEIAPKVLQRSEWDRDAGRLVTLAKALDNRRKAR